MLSLIWSRQSIGTVIFTEFLQNPRVIQLFSFSLFSIYLYFFILKEKLLPLLVVLFTVITL